MTPSRARGRFATAMLWCARAGALASGLVLAVAAMHLLREAGLRFRWETQVRRLPPETGSLGRPGSFGAAPAGRSGSGPAARDSSLGRALPHGASGAGARIDFERFPDGSAVCAPCPLSDAFAEAGVRFSFRSWAGGSSRPHVVEVGEFAAPGEPADHAVAPAYREEKGLEVGVVAMEFPGRPARVVFELTGPDLVPRFRVTAWTPEGRIEGASILRTDARRFHAVGGGRFRREVVVVESAGGIERIELDGRGPPGHVLLVDDLSLGRATAGSVDSGATRSSSG